MTYAMKAMILAAGRGERMRPLTDTTPKPLLHAGGKPLIVWHLERLAASGFRDIVINHSHLGEQIEATLGNGNRFGLNILYSPFLGSQPFLVVNGDVWCDWDFSQAHKRMHALTGHPAHLVLVDNPPQHAGGDFSLDGETVRYAGESTGPTLTYAGTGIFSPDFFASVPAGAVMKMRPLLDAGIAKGLVTGERHPGIWVDVGTPERLAELDRELKAKEFALS